MFEHTQGLKNDCIFDVDLIIPLRYHMTTILKIMMCFVCVSLTYDNIIRTSVGSALGLLLPLTCRGPAAEVR